MKVGFRRALSRRRAGRWASGLPLRAYLAFAVGLPLLVMTVFGTAAVRDAWTERQAALDLEALADDIGALTELESVFDRERALSYSSLIIQVLGLDLTDHPELAPIQNGTDLARVRREVDRLMTVLEGRGIGIDLDQLVAVRAALNATEPSLDELSAQFALAQAPIDERWEERLDMARSLGARHELPEVVQARLRVVVESKRVLESADEQISALLTLVNGGDVQVEPVERIITHRALQEDAKARGRIEFGPRGAEAAQRLRESGASERFERLYDGFISAAILEGAVPEPDPLTVLSFLVDGVDYVDALTGVSLAASADLREASRGHAHEAGRRVAVYVALGLVVVVSSVVVVVIVGRAILRPARILEDEARRISEGEFRVAIVPPDGPRELGAAVGAFNEMAGTLTAVENLATHMADPDHDPAESVDPLPGSTGEALQGALDRLRSAMAEAARQRAELEKLATSDSLTGLLNRRAVLDELGKEMVRAWRSGSAVMALYVDLDGLKALNDTYGHDAGDAAIRTAAEVLADNTRAIDLAARVGGDEYLVIGSVPAGPEGRAQAEATAQRLLSTITSTLVRVEGNAVVPLRASVGVALAEGTDLEGEGARDRLVKAADTALYQAKRGGRGRVAWAPA